MGKVEKNIDSDTAKDTYGLQNFITISEPLPKELVETMLPT
jgi:hypothetical protein